MRRRRSVSVTIGATTKQRPSAFIAFGNGYCTLPVRLPHCTIWCHHSRESGEKGLQRILKISCALPWSIFALKCITDLQKENEDVMIFSKIVYTRDTGMHQETKRYALEWIKLS